MYYNFFIGIDVSKQYLDLALLASGRLKKTVKIENESKAIQAVHQ